MQIKGKGACWQLGYLQPEETYQKLVGEIWELVQVCLSWKCRG